MNTFKNLFWSTLAAFTLGAATINAQDTNFHARVENTSGQGLAGKKVEVYFNQGNGQQRYENTTDQNGNTTINKTTDITIENKLPEGYSISQNYPNPFSQNTKINIDAKQESSIELKIYDILGKEVETISKEISAGTTPIQIAMDENATGVYFAQVILKTPDNKKYVQTKKMLLMRGYEFNDPKPTRTTLPKMTTTTTIDSVVITGDAIKRKTITGFPTYTGDDIQLGTFIVDSNYVNLVLNIKKLMEWTQPNNQQTNALVNVSGREAITDANGQATFEHLPSGKNSLLITHPEIYTRETILHLENDSTHTEYILDTLNYTQTLMNFTDDTFGRIWPATGKKFNRWTEPPIFYIVADTTTEEGRTRALQQIAKIDTVLAPAYTTPVYPEGFLKNREIQIGTTNIPYGQEGYYVITWEDISPNIGLTYVETDTTTGKIKYAQTRYNSLADANTMERITIHELSSGMSFAGRSNTIPSVWNLPLPPQQYRNFAPTDKQMILYQYSRPPGNKIIDKDDGF